MNDRFFPTGRPLAVDGGIKARSTRGAIATTWWSGRFIAVLESLGLGGRLQRGRRYARTGQVIEILVTAGSVTASVQGSRAQPYRVRIGVSAFDKTQWARIERTLADKAWYAAQLLSGSMPDDLEEVFVGAGLALFPASGKDLSMDCSCPDWTVPCKHVAAVCYLLAESFDEDPFRILAWRGRERGDLLANLRALRAITTTARTPLATSRIPSLTEALGSFYEPVASIPTYQPTRLPPDAVLRQLPHLPLAIRGVPVVDLLRPAYLRMSEGDLVGRDSAAGSDKHP